MFLTAACAVPALIFLAGRPRAASVSVPVWDGGIVSFRPRMQYSAMTFSAPTRVTFDALYRPSVSVRRASDDDPAGRSGPVHYEAQVTPVFERYLYRPVIRAVEWLADAIRPLQSGDVNLYLLYVFADDPARLPARRSLTRRPGASRTWQAHPARLLTSAR